MPRSPIVQGRLIVDNIAHFEQFVTPHISQSDRINHLTQSKTIRASSARLLETATFSNNTNSTIKFSRSMRDGSSRWRENISNPVRSTSEQSRKGVILEVNWSTTRLCNKLAAQHCMGHF